MGDLRYAGPSPVTAVGMVPKSYVDAGLASKQPAGSYAPAPSVGTLAYATNITPVATAATSFFVAATGNFTLNAPTGPADGQMLMVEVRASVAVTVTIAAAILLTTGLAASLAVVSGRSGFIGLRYSAAAAAWYLLAATSGS